MATVKSAPTVHIARWLALLLWCASPIATTRVCFAQAGDPLASVLEAWEKRQAETHSLAVSWTQDHVLLKGSVLRPPAGESPQPSVDAVIPPQDVTLQGKYRLLIDGQRMLYSEDNDLWSPHTNTGYRQQYSATFADRLSKAFFPTSASPYPIGEIEPSQPPLALTNHRNVRPLRLIFRPLDNHWRGFPADRLTLRPYHGVYEGRSCPIVSYVENGHVTTDVWVDPAREYNPIKHIVTVDGVVTSTAEIEYRKDAHYGWTPVGWQWNEMSDDKLSLTYIAAIKDIKLNAAVDASQFNLQFAPGTWVFDKAEGAEYILREDGSRRYVARGEGSADYERLLHEKPFISGTVVANTIAATLLLLLVLLRRRARAVQPAT